jgi:hypothetical protein
LENNTKRAIYINSQIINRKGIVMLKRHFLWLLYGIFVVLAIIFKNDEALFVSSGPYPFGKPILWLVLGLFLLYSLHCHLKEDFFKTMSITGKYYWTKQIGVDLYLGVALSASVIYLNEGSLLVLGLWLLPLIVFANLAALLYFAMNYDAIIRYFI